MTTRREFIQAGAVLGAFAAPAGAALAATPLSGRTLPLHKVAYDGRSEAGLIFAAEAQRLGAEVHDTRGDVSDLYANDLLERWRRTPAPVAGLTNHASMFVLQMMATSADLRLVWRAHHVREAAGYTHTTFGPDAVRAQVGEIAGGELDWARQAARAVMRLPVGEATVARARSNIAEAEQASIRSDTLVSWVLAPVRRA